MSARIDPADPLTWMNPPPGTEEARQRKQKANGHDADAATPDDKEGKIEFRQIGAIDPALIPPRPWAYGKFLLFGTAAVIGAVDGSGKGAIAVAMMIAMITKIPVLGEKVWRSGPVCIVTYEDDEEEWRRRIAAACINFRDKGVDYAQVMAGVHFVHKPGGKVTFAMQAARGGTLFPDSQAIIDGIRAIGAVLLIVDPFNSAHAMDDGNNNILIARVAHELSRIAKQSGAAVLVLHHLRKGSSGDVDDLMGATSLRANFRNCRIYQRMTSDQADELKVPANQRWRYLRIASVKANYAPPPDDCIWFSLASVLLGNANDLYTEGDEIGVAVPWKPPSAFDGLDRPTMGSIFAHLRREPSPGWRWSLNSKQKHWAGKVLLDLAPDMSREQAKRVLDTWHKNGAISEETYVNPNRDEATGIVLNEELISRMLPPSRDENE